METTKAQEAKMAEAREEGFSFFWARTHTGNTSQFVGQTWEDGGFRVNDDGEPVKDSRGNSVASSKVEELDPTNAAHLAQCEEWWG